MSDLTITRVEAIPYAIPYRKPLRFASGEILAAEHVLVRVHTDDGLVGTADAPPRPFPYGETQAPVTSVIRDLFAPAICGLGVLEREVVHARMNRTVANPVAKAAIDMALWDVLGQSLGVSVSELLGGFTDRLRVSHMVGFAPPEQMVAEAKHRADSMIGDARTRSETLDRESRAKAAALEQDAERRHLEAMSGLEEKRSSLERKIEELRTMEREYRTRLRSFLESNLRDLDSRGSAEPATNTRQTQHATA